MMKSKRNGLGILLALAALAAVSVAILLISEGASTLLFHSRQAYTNALQQDLQISALNWARVNNQQIAAMKLGQEITLPTDSLQKNTSAISIMILEKTSRQAKIEIKTLCRPNKPSIQKRIYFVSLN